MFCSGCGTTLAAGQPICPQCGRPVLAAPMPPVPGFQFELNAYAGKLRALSVVWYIYGGLSLLFGILGLAFADAFFSGRMRWWTHGPMPPHMWFGPELIHFAWIFVVLRSALALAAGWGLMERTSWGRIVAIVAAFLSLLKIPVGTALGIWTLVVLLGYRNTTLYDHVSQG